MDSILSGFSNILPQATGPDEASKAATAVQAESKATPKFNREDLRAVLADPEVTKAIKEASQQGMKEGYISLMRKFMGEFPKLLAPLLGAKDPIAAFNNFINGSLKIFEDMSGGENPKSTTTAPQIVAEAKPASTSNQADAMMKVLAQYMPQAQQAAPATA